MNTLKKIQEDQNGFNQRIRELINDLVKIDDKYKQENFKNKLKFENRFRREKISMVIHGFMKSGKSSLLNIIFSASTENDENFRFSQQDFFPVEQTDESFTAIIWELNYVDDWKKISVENGLSFTEKELSENSYILERRNEDDSSKRYERILLSNDQPGNDLLKFVQNLRENNSRNLKVFNDEFKPIVRIYLNADVLKNLRIIDSPGKGENKELNELVDQTVKECDLLIYVFKVNELSQQDMSFLREMRSQWKDSNIPLCQRIIFVGNKVDILIPKEPNQQIELIQNNIPTPKLLENLENTKELILLKLNSELLFNGEIRNDQIFLTCCQKENNELYSVFEENLKQLKFCVNMRKKDMMFTIPANATYLPTIERITNLIDSLESSKNSIHEMGSTIEGIRKKKPKLMQEIETHQKEMITEMRDDLKALFEDTTIKEEIQNLICEEDITDSSLEVYWWKKTMEEAALESIAQRLQTVITNRIDGILKKRIKNFRELMLDTAKITIDETIKKSKFKVSQEGGMVMMGGVISAIAGAGLGFQSMLLVGGVGMFIPGVNIVIIPVGLITGIVGGLITAFSLVSNRLTSKSSSEKYNEDWRRKKFQEMWKGLKLEEILKNVSESFEKMMSVYVEAYENYFDEKILSLEKQKNLGREEMTKMSLELCKLEFIALTIKHDFLLPKKFKYSIDSSPRIGGGTFGEVIEGTYGEEEEIAVKIQECTSKSRFENCIREVHILHKFSRMKDVPNLVKMISAKYNSERRLGLIFLERHPMNLRRMIFDPKVSLIWRVKALIQICDSVFFLHSRKLFHRDLKPSNCLVGRDKKSVYICDFGTSKPIGMSHGTFHGSPYYVDPCIYWKNQWKIKLEYDLRIDSFSFGVLMAVLYEQKGEEDLFSLEYSKFGEEKPTDELLEAWKDKKMLKCLSRRYENTKDVMKEYQDLMFSCVRLNVEERPHFSDILEGLKKILVRLEGKEEENEGEDAGWEIYN